MAITNTLIVDPTPGNGDHTTIQAAINAAVAAGASASSLWMVEVRGIGPSSGTWAENLTIPSGIHLNGWGPRSTRIAGTVTINSASRLSNLEIAPPADTATVALNCVANALNSIHIHDVHIFITNSTNASVVGVRYDSGTYSQPIVYIQRSHIYVRNPYNGAGTAAKTVHFETLGQSGYIEVEHVHCKSSNGVGGTTEAVFHLNSSTHEYGGVLAGDVHWWPRFVTAPTLLRSTNAAWKGGEYDVSIMGNLEIADVAVIVPSAVESLKPLLFPHRISKHVETYAAGIGMDGADSALSVGPGIGVSVPAGPVRVSMVRSSDAGSGVAAAVYYGEMNGAGTSVQGVQSYTVANPGSGQTLFQALPAPANNEFRGAGQLTWNKDGQLILNSPSATGVVVNQAHRYTPRVARLSNNVATVQNVYGWYVEDLTNGGGTASTYLFYSVGTAPAYMAGELTAAGLKVKSGSTTYAVAPEIVESRPPTDSDVAPVGTSWKMIA
jgi:hypothetical protein